MAEDNQLLAVSYFDTTLGQAVFSPFGWLLLLLLPQCNILFGLYGRILCVQKC